MKNQLTGLFLIYSFSGFCQDPIPDKVIKLDHQSNTFTKNTFVGVSLGSVSFRDGISSALRYNMPSVGLRFEHQKTSPTHISYFNMSLAYAKKPSENRYFEQSFQTNFNYARLLAISKNIYLGGESSANLHTRFGKNLAQTQANAIGGNLVFSLNPAIQYRKTLIKKTGNLVFSDTFSGAVLGLAASGSGNYQGYAGPIFTFSALNKFYTINNRICIDFQNKSQKSTWRLAYHWEFSTFRSPINSQYGSSLISISKKL
jgi:hypothetical protein